MRMVKALDAGPSILQARTPIPDDETYGELQLRLAEMGALALDRGARADRLGQAPETPQDDAAGDVRAEDRSRDDARRLDGRRGHGRRGSIRAFDPRPGAFTQCDERRGQAVRRARRRRASGGAPGEVLAIDDDGMTVACGERCRTDRKRSAGGKAPARAAEWARGRGIAVGRATILGWYARRRSGPIAVGDSDGGVVGGGAWRRRRASSAAA